MIVSSIALAISKLFDYTIKLFLRNSCKINYLFFYINFFGQFRLKVRKKNKSERYLIKVKGNWETY